MTAAPKPLSDEDRRDHWVQTAAHAQRLINMGWWLNVFVPTFTVSSVVLSALLLLGRKFGLSSLLLQAIGASLACVLCTVTYLIAKRSFFDRRATLAELDRALNLNNALTCADLSVGRWPSTSQRASMPNLRWREISLPLLFGVALLLAAAFVPVARNQVALNLNPDSPPAWAETEKVLESIEESGVASPEALKRFEERLESLRAEPEERWYDHSTLEASESLLQDAQRAKEELAAGVSALGEALQRAEQASAQLQQGDASERGAASAGKKDAQANLEQNLKELAEGNMPLADDLSAALESAASAAEELSPEQAKALHDRLKAAKESLEKSQGEGQGKGDPSGAKGDGKQNPGGGGEGKNGEKGDGMTADSPSGSCGTGEECTGGTSRGPGTAPIEYKDQQSPALATRPELIKGDPEHREGDRELRQLEKLQPEEQRQLAAGGEGGVAQLEKGGDAVVRGDYTPEERRILESYFK